jgi:hypothetical protein
MIPRVIERLRRAFTMRSEVGGPGFISDLWEGSDGAPVARFRSSLDLVANGISKKTGAIVVTRFCTNPSRAELVDHRGRLLAKVVIDAFGKHAVVYLKEADQHDKTLFERALHGLHVEFS